MQPAGRIDVQDWMQAPATRAVMGALAAEGARALFVGGCVRNTLLGRPADDIDIATEATPQEAMRLLQQAGIKVVATGIEHGTVTAVIDGRGLEITTLRRDAETFGRKARVEFTDDWLQDAGRRDFTFNALYCDDRGTLYDPFDGRADLERGVVRFVGSAMQRIAEDYLRAFRFFRFLAWYGRPPADEAAIEAIVFHAPHLAELSGERVRKEMLRLLAAPDPEPATGLMLRHGVLVHWLPEAESAGGLVPMLALEKAAGVAPDALRRLLALLAPDADGEAIAARWRFSRAEQARLVAALRPAPKIAGLDAQSVRELVYRVGNRTALDRLMLHGLRGGAEAGDAALVAALVAALRLARDWPAPRFPLAGADVLALGVAPGAEIGWLLGAVEEWWIAGDFAADAGACRAELKRTAERRR
ncbi:MAG: CCA tRNA nucleotidyltransferase [Reyranellaceae bacterium]